MIACAVADCNCEFGPAAATRPTRVVGEEVRSCQQERRRLGILHRLGLRSCIPYGPGLRPSILPDICSAFLHVLDDVCPRNSYGPGPSVLLHGRDGCWGIFRDRCRVILYGLSQIPRILLGAPRLEFPKQGFRCLTVFSLSLAGGFRGTDFASRDVLRSLRRLRVSG